MGSGVSGDAAAKGRGTRKVVGRGEMRRGDSVEKLPAASRAELLDAVCVNNDNDGDESVDDPFLAAATSRKWKVSGKKKYLKEFNQQIDQKTIDKARLAPRADDPIGYMTLVDMLRDSWAKNGALEGELQGIVDKFSE